MNRYRTVLALSPFGRVWFGATASILGDSMTSVALLWLVYQRTHQASAVGWLEFAYGAPVLVGGLATGGALQRFGVVRTLRWDSSIRAAIVASVPISMVFGTTPLWLAYLVASVYGLMKMIPLAGIPTLIGESVPADLRHAANALEALAYGSASIVGPLLAAAIISTVGAPWVLAVDAGSFVFLAGVLAGLREAASAAPERAPATLAQAARFVLTSGPVRTVTLMFSAFNAGYSVLLVLLPVYAVQVLHGGASTYGLLAGTLAVGEVGGAVFAGWVAWRPPLGRSIALAQTLAGVALVGMLLEPGLPISLTLLLVSGLFGGPLTVWAQTLRMAAIPASLRGHAFSLLRTVMQAAAPAGGAIGGFLVTSGIPLASAVVGGTISLSGTGGLLSPSLSPQQDPTALSR